jgi:hypothetical protein
MASLRQSSLTARTPIVILFTYRIVTLAVGLIFTPPAIARLFLELLYWLLYASIGWSLGRGGLGKPRSVAGVTALVFAAEFGILIIYFAWPALYGTSVQSGMRGFVTDGLWYLPLLVCVSVIAAYVAARTRRVGDQPVKVRYD